jgi:hypothetical protein
MRDGVQEWSNDVLHQRLFEVMQNISLEQTHKWQISSMMNFNNDEVQIPSNAAPMFRRVAFLHYFTIVLLHTSGIDLTSALKHVISAGVHTWTIAPVKDRSCENDIAHCPEGWRR